MTTADTETPEQAARRIVEKVANAAIELAFTRHELTTTNYEEEEYADIEEAVEAFKALVEEVKADVLACLTGDDTGCLDPEDVDYDNELRFTERAITNAVAVEQVAARRMFAAELLGHLDRVSGSGTTAAYHLMKGLCQIELGQKPDSLGARVD